MDATVSFLWPDSAGNEVLMAADGSQPSSVTAGFEPMRFADGWGVVTPASDENFSGLCRALGVDGSDDPRVATSVARRQHMQLVNEMLDMCHAKAAGVTVEEARERFDAVGLSYAFVNTMQELIEDPHAVAVGLFEEFDHPVVGPVRMARHPVRFGRTPARVTADAPQVGEHTDEVLTGLGLGDRIAALRERGVVA
jgi:crotonobetainyl-CoA:carnitine CoA-transferase CaiB-like acyl-CoA transferase